MEDYNFLHVNISERIADGCSDQAIVDELSGKVEDLDYLAELIREIRAAE